MIWSFGKKKVPDDPSIHPKHKKLAQAPGEAGRPATIATTPAEVKPVATKPKPAAPASDKERLKLREAAFAKLNIPFTDVAKAEAFLGVVYSPESIPLDASTLSAELRKQGYRWMIDAYEMFNIMFVWGVENRRRDESRKVGKSNLPPVTVVEVAIFREVERRVRKKKGLPLDKPIDPSNSSDFAAERKALEEEASNNLWLREAELRLRRERHLTAKEQVSVEDVRAFAALLKSGQIH